MRKTARQLDASISRPPRTGPAAAAIEVVAPHRPTAAARFSGLETASTIPSAAGIMNAALAPCSARTAISTGHARRERAERGGRA